MTMAKRQRGKLVDADYDATGRCIKCRIHRRDNERVEELLIAGKATSVHRYVECGHTMIYRSEGVWTALASSKQTIGPSNICMQIANRGPNGEPVACAYVFDHGGPHSWAAFVPWLGAQLIGPSEVP